jgi:MFS family permease
VFVLVISAGVVLLVPVASTVVAELAPVELRGRYMSAWTMVYLGGSALGPIFGGYSMAACGAKTAFLIVGFAGLLGAVLFLPLRSLLGLRRFPGTGSGGDAGLQPSAHAT